MENTTLTYVQLCGISFRVKDKNTKTCHYCKKKFSSNSNVVRHIEESCKVGKEYRKKIGLPRRLLTKVKKDALKNIKKWCVLHFTRQLYRDQQVGLKALSYTWLTDNYLLRHYNRLVIVHKIPLEEVAKEWNILSEWKSQRKDYMCEGRGVTNWSIEKMDEIALTLIQKHGHIPCYQWLRQNGYGSFSCWAYSNGYNSQSLQERFNYSKCLTSRSGLLLLSQAEVSFSDFLYSRGIEHRRGRQYLESFCKQYGYTKCMYDFHFLGRIDPFTKTEISIEIWGNLPQCMGGERYSIVRRAKENFHRQDVSFLGIEFTDCYNEDRLVQLLRPYIGIIKPYQFKSPHDRIVRPVQWSLADKVKEQCEIILQKTEGVLPTEDWMRKRGKFKNRSEELWERDLPFNLHTLVKHIRTIGGYRKTRQILSIQNQSSIKWTIELIHKVLLKIYREHQESPKSIYARLREKDNLGNDENDLKNTLQNVLAATDSGRYCTYSDVCRELGIPFRFQGDDLWTFKYIPQFNEYIEQNRTLIGIRKSFPNMVTRIRSGKITVPKQYQNLLNRNFFLWSRKSLAKHVSQRFCIKLKELPRAPTQEFIDHFRELVKCVSIRRGHKPFGKGTKSVENMILEYKKNVLIFQQERLQDLSDRIG